jgi:hypothetical protein
MRKINRKKPNKKTGQDEEGFAIFEALTFLMAFIIFTVYVIDLFTAIHTGIVGSIAARTYAFETFQHRTNLSALRQADETPEGDQSKYNYAAEHERFHAVTEELGPDNGPIVPSGRLLTQVSADDKIDKVTGGGLDNSNNQTSTIRIKTGYGICLDAQCPGDTGL